MIRKLRNKIRMSQKELSEKLNITQGYLSKLESRNNKYCKNVTVELIVKMAEVLKVEDTILFKYFAESFEKENQS